MPRCSRKDARSPYEEIWLSIAYRTTPTWDDANQYYNLGIVPFCYRTATVPASPSITEDTPGMVSFNVTELVQAWYAGLENYGMALKYEGGSNGSVIIKSWEAGSSTRSYYEVTYVLEDLPVDNGTYYIKNGKFDKYMQLDDNESPSTEGAILELWDYDGASDQKWTFEYMHNGYYKISSATSGKAITAPTDVNDSITQEDYEVSNNQLWKITVASGGMYKLSPASDLSYYMAAGDGIFTSDGRNVEMRSSQSDNKDEWYIRPLTYAFSIGGEFHSGADVIDAANNWTQCGHISTYNINPTASNLNYNNLNSEVIYFSSHGSQHRLALLNNVFLADGLTNVTADTVEINNFTLPNAKLYVYDACLTASDGDGSGRNLCTETIAAGVDCVIGWTEEIGVTDARNWQTRFQSKLVAGESVISAANYANTFSYNNNTSIKSWVIYGNQDLIINEDAALETLSTSSVISLPEIKITDIVYLEHNEDTIKTILSDNFTSFSDNAASVTLTYTNISKTNYVIDYYYLHKGFNTSSGYSIIVENGVIKQIRDNTIMQNENMLRQTLSPTPIVTQTIINNAIMQASAEVMSINSEYVVVKQFGDKYYDIETGKYYYRVMSTYVTPDNTTGAIFTFYEF